MIKRIPRKVNVYAMPIYARLSISSYQLLMASELVSYQSFRAQLAIMSLASYASFS